MSIGDSAIFGMMSDKMSWLSQRQRVLSQNIANADTPNFKCRVGRADDETGGDRR